jgi:hypothetical protein
MRCDWAQINLPLECFLNGSQPQGPSFWQEAVLAVVSVLVFCAVGAIIEWKGRNK